ncbi:sarcosine oxidase subunit gamma [Acidiphilium sp.]|uniref:sarcosine oxidase subunit gamma n=1 Tax=Acidiphilium sp. TaxID=527 RepID=UPI003D0918C0
MADFIRPAEPPRATPLAVARDHRLHPAAPMRRFSLRVREAALAAAGRAIGLDLAVPINRAATAGGRAALRLGPDDWLILTAPTDPDIAAPLRTAMEGAAFSLVDISHRQTGIRLESPNAAAMLNACCPLDLDRAAFPPGMATRTLFAKAEIMLWRTGITAFHLEIWRSFTPYVIGLLSEIGREYPE